MEGEWDTTVSSFQDILNANEALPLDSVYADTQISSLSNAELKELKSQIVAHKENAEKATRLLETALENANSLFKHQSQSSKGPAAAKGNNAGKSSPAPVVATTATTTAAAAAPAATKQKKGKSYYTSIYNSSEPIVPGSEVAYKLRQRGAELEWIQCEVTKIVSEIKFEVRDPEPDENNNPGQTYKATWKDVILLPLKSEAASLVNYPYGTKVLARYPETTTFYPAEVIGTKRDGRCRLRFDGEEEEGKETEVERRLVVPYPK